MRYELSIALRYLRARRKDAFISMTTMFSAVGVMIGVAALIVTLSVMGGFEAEPEAARPALSPQVQILSVERIDRKLFRLAVEGRRRFPA